MSKDRFSKIRSEKKARKFVDELREIREDITHNILETGKKWIITVRGIPSGPMTEEELRGTIEWLKEFASDSIPDFRIHMKAVNLFEENYVYTFDEIERKLLV